MMRQIKITHTGTWFQALFCFTLAPVPWFSPEGTHLVSLVHDSGHALLWTIGLGLIGIILMIGAIGKVDRCRHFGLPAASVFWLSMFALYAQELVYTPLTVTFLNLSVAALVTYFIEMVRSPLELPKGNEND